MVAARMGQMRPAAYRSRGNKGLWVLALTAVALGAIIGLMMASTGQAPYGATQVWSAEPIRSVAWVSTPPPANGLVGASDYGQDTAGLPATTLVHFGAR